MSMIVWLWPAMRGRVRPSAWWSQNQLVAGV
jgi:hypothetical protein